MNRIADLQTAQATLNEAAKLVDAAKQRMQLAQIKRAEARRLNREADELVSEANALHNKSATLITHVSTIAGVHSLTEPYPLPL